MPEEPSTAISWEGYNLGNPISSNPGVNCYPAVGSDGKRYIVKSISVPASQTQLDALLLTGAFTQSTDAVDYFRQKAEQIANEAELLTRLSKLEGFVGYKNWKISPLDENRLGYQIRMVGTFKRSLERYMRTNTMTHLETVNLGLDLCAALACCRRAGYLYINLKPTNIFISQEREYKIGDLGFAALDALNFSSMPLTCASAYTAPELRDGLKTINETVDTYGVGMILYRILNNGKLPPKNRDWSTVLPMPVNADEEIGEIILKACAPDPADRWENPTVMGQALVAYMQRNAINDVPVTEPVVNRQTGKLPTFTGRLPNLTAAQTMVFKPAVQAAPEEAGAEEKPAVPAEEAQTVVTEESVPAEPISPVEMPVTEPVAEEVPVTVDTAAESPAAEPPVPETTGEKVTEAEPSSAETIVEVSAPEESAQEKAEEVSAPVASAEESVPEVAVKESAVAQTAAEVIREENKTKEIIKEIITDVSEDAAPEMLLEESTADLPANEPVVKPVPAPNVVKPVPAPSPAKQPQPVFRSQKEEMSSSVKTEQQPSANRYAEPRLTYSMPVAPKHYNPGNQAEFNEKPARSFKFLKIMAVMILLGCLLAGLALGGLWVYRNHYVQVIDALEVTGSREGITVTVTTKADMSKMEVSCVDAYGNGQTKPLNDGEVVFTDLKAGGLYNIKVTATGHKLEGETYTIFTTDSEAKIVSLSAVTGTESGSMVLSLTVDGTEPEKWLVVCTTPGSDDVSASFTGHVVTVRGLTAGKDYTVTVSAEDGSAVSGQTTLEFAAKNLELAQNIHLENGQDGELLVSWDPPAAAVGSWKVRCFNDNYDQEVTVWDTGTVFTGIDSAQSYTVEITAEGMTQSARATISANPITVKNFHAEVQDEKLVFSWEHTGRNPEGGWLVNYTVDGSSPSTLKAETDGEEISFAIPGATYEFTILAADETSIFDNVHTYQVPEAPAYKGHTIILSKVTISTLKTPAEEGWLVENVDKDAFTDTFAAGDKISLALKATCKFYLEDEDITVRYVFRDASGKAVPGVTATQETDWNTIWYDGNYQEGELNLPLVPTQSGEYTLEVYFNGGLFGSTQFKIT